ncbi:FitA-like ribbon-helix-helix domain-containing protein [Leptolyngbya sp. AN03gr2]|uniref:FitA-like ribbon-helix-helix domain-containing protein n=1 Tax=unclassified Leptolyngbya TaxID=2650499 RepID=UPI003D32293B
MATLLIQNLPDDLLAQIQQLAEQHDQSIDSQIIVLLSSAIQSERSKLTQAKLLQQIEEHRSFCPANHGLPDSLTLLQDDRAR